ncbi:YIP1 family protein [Bacillus tuaregi]|uniref:YIP1 family protein n=1 Tax=Bacillus tuaregi TaxID=1816695 RepID=UPI0009FFCBEB|nr:YIP1 family protein [Bacillus tuaregi]
MYHIRLFRGLREPYVQAQQLVKAEQVGGFWRKGLLLLLMTFLVAAVSAYFGIGNEILSKEIHTRSNTEFEAIKLFFAIGQIIWSLLQAIIILTIPSLFFWALSDIEWKKYIAMQFYVLTILLIGKIITIPFTVLLGLPDISNPFSLGVIGQYLTSHDLTLQFLSGITIFTIWAMLLQYKFVRALSQRPRWQTMLFVLGFNLFLLAISVFLQIMDLEKLL